MGQHNEMTRYAFISHMEDYMKKLLTNPMKADTDEFLKSHGIKGPVALKMLLKRTNPDDENSSIIIRSEKIKDNGNNENGKKNPESFTVKYKIPRKDYTKKMRNLYINLFESNIVENCPLFEEISVFNKQNEMVDDNSYKDRGGIKKLSEEDGGGCMDGMGGANNAGQSGAVIQPLSKKPIRNTLYITEKQASFLKEAVAGDVGQGYTVPISKGNENDKFFKETLNHKNIMKKSWLKK